MATQTRTQQQSETVQGEEEAGNLTTIAHGNVTVFADNRPQGVIVAPTAGSSVTPPWTVVPPVDPPNPQSFHSPPVSGNTPSSSSAQCSGTSHVPVMFAPSFSAAQIQEQQRASMIPIDRLQEVDPWMNSSAPQERPVIHRPNAWDRFVPGQSSGSGHVVPPPPQSPQTPLFERPQTQFMMNTGTYTSPSLGQADDLFGLYGNSYSPNPNSAQMPFIPGTVPQMPFIPGTVPQAFNAGPVNQAPRAIPSQAPMYSPYIPDLTNNDLWSNPYGGNSVGHLGAEAFPAPWNLNVDAANFIPGQVNPGNNHGIRPSTGPFMPMLHSAVKA